MPATEGRHSLSRGPSTPFGINSPWSGDEKPAVAEELSGHFPHTILHPDGAYHTLRRDVPSPSTIGNGLSLLAFVYREDLISFENAVENSDGGQANKTVRT